MSKNFITYILSVLAGIFCFLFVLNWVLDEYGYMGAILLPLILVSIFLMNFSSIYYFFPYLLSPVSLAHETVLQILFFKNFIAIHLLKLIINFPDLLH